MEKKEKKYVQVDKQVFNAMNRNGLKAVELNAKLNMAREALQKCQYYIVNTPVYPQGDEQKQKEIHDLLNYIEDVLGKAKGQW